MDELNFTHDQLKRMRSMNKFYHHQFLIDVRIFFILGLIALIFALFNTKIAYILPFLSLFGSVILAFHAYYLIFSRHYAEYLENIGSSKFFVLSVKRCGQSLVEAAALKSIVLGFVDCIHTKNICHEYCILKYCNNYDEIYSIIKIFYKNVKVRFSFPFFSSPHLSFYANITFSGPKINICKKYLKFNKIRI